MARLNNPIGPDRAKGKRQATGRAKRAVFVLTAYSAGLAAATQYFAHQFSYHAALGPRLGYAYAPWSVIAWAGQWYDRYPGAFQQAGGVGLVVTGSGLLALLVADVKARKSADQTYLHGSARWAEAKDLFDCGLLKKPSLLDTLRAKHEDLSESVVVGGWRDEKGRLRYLYDSGPSHILTYAPTRSGKGVSLVLPTLFTWQKSVVAYDLKGELYALTAGWREKYAGNRILRFEPGRTDNKVAWNPLDEIRLGPEEVGDVQDLATLLVDPDGQGLKSHWDKTSRALLVGLILHCLYKAKREGLEASLNAVDGLISNPDSSLQELWMEMRTYPHLDKGDVHPTVARTASDMLNTPEEELGSIVSTTKTHLDLYRDPVVAKNTSRSDFRVKDLMNGASPTTLYIVTAPNSKARMRPLVRVLLNMIMRLNTDTLSFKNGKAVPNYLYRLLMLYDEFPSLGKLGIVEESLAFLAGYGIKAYIICQDINQLKSREIGYGPDEAISSNCHIQNGFPPNRIDTAEYLSKLAGVTTVQHDDESSSTQSGSFRKSKSYRQQPVQRPLITADECLRLQGPLKNGAGEIVRAGSMLIYVAGFPMVYGEQTLFFKDPVWDARSKVMPTERVAPYDDETPRITLEAEPLEAVT